MKSQQGIKQINSLLLSKPDTLGKERNTPSIQKHIKLIFNKSFYKEPVTTPPLMSVSRIRKR